MTTNAPRTDALFIFRMKRPVVGMSDNCKIKDKWNIVEESGGGKKRKKAENIFPEPIFNPTWRFNPNF